MVSPTAVVFDEILLSATEHCTIEPAGISWSAA
jgi:hypothetical protein